MDRVRSASMWLVISSALVVHAFASLLQASPNVSPPPVVLHAENDPGDKLLVLLFHLLRCHDELRDPGWRLLVRPLGIPDQPHW